MNISFSMYKAAGYRINRHLLINIVLGRWVVTG